MRASLSVPFVLVIVLTLAGCGGGSSHGSTGTGSSNNTGNNNNGNNNTGNNNTGNNNNGNNNTGSHNNSNNAGGGSTSLTAPLTPANITTPDHTVGTGTPASVTQAALQAALDAGGSIVFNAGTVPYTLSLTSTLNVTKDVTIDGANLLSIDGNGSNRVFETSGSVSLWLQNMTIKNASVSDKGGGIFANMATKLVAINVTFANDAATDTGSDIGGGAAYCLLVPSVTFQGCTFTECRGSNGGAVGSLGSQLIVFACTFLSNQAHGSGGSSDGIGGAIYMDGVHQAGTNHVFSCGASNFSNNTATSHGGAIFTFLYSGTSSSSTIQQTTFDGNSSTGGLGLAGAVYHQNEQLTIDSSTFSNNNTVSQGGGLWLISGTGATITNCTFSANKANELNQALGGGLAISDGPVTITASTFAENYAGNFGGGVFASTSANVTAKNLLFWNNVGVEPYNGLNCNRALTDGGGNMQWPATRPNGSADTMVASGSTFADALLEALAANGGPVKTRALPATSPALNKGVSGGPTTDARGHTRKATPDIGAYESP